MLEGHTRPFDWEQEVLLRCQRWMVQQGYSLEKAFSVISGGNRSGISKKRFGEWVLQIDPLLYLEQVDRVFNKFKLVDGEGRQGSRTLLLPRHDLAQVSAEEFLRMVKLLDRSLSEVEARELVKALTLTELQVGGCWDNVDVMRLQRRFDHHNAQSSDADSNLLESIQKALNSQKMSPKAFFDKFDLNRDSKLSEEELNDGLQSLGIRKLMFLTDKDNNGFLDIDEFVSRFGLESVKKSDKFAHLATK
eukprot:747940-Hanusia_phi.AAC.5